MEYYIAPTDISPATRALYAAEAKLWPNVSMYKTLPRIRARMKDIAAKLRADKSKTKSTTRTKLRNEWRLLHVKQHVVGRPHGPSQKADDVIFAFARFLWGSDMAFAETAAEKREARQEETMKLMELSAWLDKRIAALDK